MWKWVSVLQWPQRERLLRCTSGMSQSAGYFPLTQARGHSLNPEINHAQGPRGTVFVLHGSNSAHPARKDSRSTLTGSEEINCCLCLSLPALRDCPLLVGDFETAFLKKIMLIKTHFGFDPGEYQCHWGCEDIRAPHSGEPAAVSYGLTPRQVEVLRWSVHSVPREVCLKYSLHRNHPNSNDDVPNFPKKKKTKNHPENLLKYIHVYSGPGSQRC